MACTYYLPLITISVFFTTVFLVMVCQDHVAKEKALQTMSSMSSAQIVSATAMHSKSAGLGLGLTPPVSYPGAVSCLPHPPAKLSLFLILHTYSAYQPPSPFLSISWFLCFFLQALFCFLYAGWFFLFGFSVILFTVFCVV